MPITQSALVGSSTTVNAGSYTTASITPGSSQLVVAVIVTQSDTNPAPSQTLSGNGLTWVEAATVEFPGNTRERVSMFRTMGASPSTGQVTVSATASKGAFWSIYQFDGIDTGGTNGSAAVVQVGSSQGSGTSLSVTLAAFGDANNGATSGWARDGDQALTPETGWTEIDDLGFATPGTRGETQWRTGEDTSPSVSWATASSAGGIAIEIKVAAAAAVEILDESFASMML